MTAGPAENAAAVATQAKGEAAEARHQADAQAQHQASGSTVVVEDASTADDVSVSWIPSGDNAAQATLVPSSPPPVNSAERDPSDPT
jgi:hypothetical protein